MTGSFKKGDEIPPQSQRVIKKTLNWPRYEQDHNYKNI